MLSCGRGVDRAVGRGGIGERDGTIGTRGIVRVKQYASAENGWNRDQDVIRRKVPRPNVPIQDQLRAGILPDGQRSERCRLASRSQGDRVAGRIGLARGQRQRLPATSRTIHRFRERDRAGRARRATRATGSRDLNVSAKEDRIVQDHGTAIARGSSSVARPARRGDVAIQGDGRARIGSRQSNGTTRSTVRVAAIPITSRRRDRSHRDIAAADRHGTTEEPSSGRRQCSAARVDGSRHHKSTSGDRHRTARHVIRTAGRQCAGRDGVAADRHTAGDRRRSTHRLQGHIA